MALVGGQTRITNGLRLLAERGSNPYHNKLTAQSLAARFIVLTNKSGTNLSAAMINGKDVKKIGKLSVSGFVAENVTYRYYAKSEEEAHYLVGVLNTRVVNDAIKPFQPQGLLGERDIHRRPFEVCNIPIFDPTNELHREIGKIAAACRAALLPIIPKMQLAVGQARSAARELVGDKIARLDDLTASLLGSSGKPAGRQRVADSQGRLL